MERRGGQRAVGSRRGGPAGGCHKSLCGLCKSTLLSVPSSRNGFAWTPRRARAEEHRRWAHERGLLSLHTFSLDPTLQPRPRFLRL